MTIHSVIHGVRTPIHSPSPKRQVIKRNWLGIGLGVAENWLGAKDLHGPSDSKRTKHLEEIGTRKKFGHNK